MSEDPSSEDKPESVPTLQRTTFWCDEVCKKNKERTLEGPIKQFLSFETLFCWRTHTVVDVGTFLAIFDTPLPHHVEILTLMYLTPTF